MLFTNLKKWIYHFLVIGIEQIFINNNNNYYFYYYIPTLLFYSILVIFQKMLNFSHCTFSAKLPYGSFRLVSLFTSHFLPDLDNFGTNIQTIWSSICWSQSIFERTSNHLFFFGLHSQLSNYDESWKQIF